MKSNISKYFVLVIFLIFSTGSGIYVFSDTSDSSSLSTQIALSIIYGLCIYLLLINGKLRLHFDWLKKDWMVILLLYCIVSVFWTADVAIVARKLIGLIGVYFVALFIVSYFEKSELIWVIFVFFSVCMISSVVISLFFPEIGTSDYYFGAWNGIYTHKNRLGRYVGLFLIFALHLFWNKRLGRHGLIKAGLSTLLGLFIMLKTDSSTSLFTVLLSIAFIYGIGKISSFGTKRVLIFFFAFLLIFPVILGIALNLEEVLLTVGKDITFTGRTYIWATVLILSYEHVLFGYGYQGFWRGELEEPSSLVVQLLGWYPSHSHNGFIDVYLTLGLAGLIVLLISFITFFRSEWRNHGRRISVSSSAIIIIYALIYNLTESTFIAPNGFMWFLVLAITFYQKTEFEK
ncbi:MAG: O-antigen ligase family protein [Cyclobacteriaceae bacterium]